MNVTIVRPAELGAGELACWRSLLAGPTFDSPYLAPEFALAAGRVRPGVRVAVHEQDGELAAFLPFETGPRGVGGPVGGGLADATGLVHRPGFRWEPRTFLRAAGLASWEFTNLLGTQVPAAARYVVREPSPVVEFPDGYDAFVAGRRAASKQGVQTLLRKRRKLEREVGALEFTFAETDAGALTTLMGWKSAQYAVLGEWDRFADPTVVGLLRELHGTTGGHCAGTLSVLTAGGRPAAAHFGVRSPTTLSWWFPAYDPELGRYSPGMQLLYLMIEAGAPQGLRRVNLGIGAHDYKDAVGTGEVEVGRGVVDDGSPGALLGRLRRAPRHHLRPLVTGNPRLHALAQGATRAVRRRRRG